MFKFILSVIVFSLISVAQAEVRNIPFKQTVISFDEQYFAQGSVEVLKIEQEYKVTMGGLGPFNVFGDYIITVKVKNLAYDKGFEIDNEFRKVLSVRMIGANQGYELWEIKTKVDSSNLELNVFMPAKFWNGTPTYGTPSGPTYYGPSYNISISKL
jgi:hypothetical protein